MENLPLEARKLVEQFSTFQDALLSSYLTTFDKIDARATKGTTWAWVAIILICIFNFLLIVIMLNLIITVMGDLFKKIKAQQEFVFLKNRAGESPKVS